MRKYYILLLMLAALIVGLLFYCPESHASAGFTEFMEEIEPVEPEEPTIEYILPTYYITDEDADLLLRIAVKEAQVDGVDGMAHVMQVVLNRVFDPAFPNTVAGVIFAPGQFTTASALADANITPEAYVALDAVIFGEYQWNDSHFFESLSGQAFSGWADYTFTYGGHDFYKRRE